MAGLSENITVRSIVDRFVEHSRIFYFENACQPEVWLSSADWTPNHFFRRIEVAFPIEDGNLRERLRGQVLETLLQDNVKARFLQARRRPMRGPGRGAARRCGEARANFWQRPCARSDLQSASVENRSPHIRASNSRQPLFPQTGVDHA